MNEILLLRIALRSLAHHKVRATLTMLGIIIGIAAIISTLAIGKGAEQKIKDRIASLGANYIYISPGNRLRSGKVKDAKRPRYKNLRTRDITAIQRQLPEIEKITPLIHLREVISHKKQNILCEVKGGNSHLMHITGRVVENGVNFSSEHINHGSRVIILGSKIAETLFCGKNPLGNKVKVQKTIFTVIGVVDEIKEYFGIMDPNTDVYMPYTAARKYVLKTRTNVIHAIGATARNKETIPKLMRQITRIMRARHKLKDKEMDDFTIFDQQTLAKAAEASSQILQLLLLIIASISLLVGGVGVMNIMLVSVTERTKEIGIRMALGATQGLILRQFLYESIVLCLIGGAIGVCLGIAAPAITAAALGWQSHVSLFSVLSAFFVTTTVGIFFGFYPARRASKLDPVVALAEK